MVRKKARVPVKPVVGEGWAAYSTIDPTKATIEEAAIRPSPSTTSLQHVTEAANWNLLLLFSRITVQQLELRFSCRIPAQYRQRRCRLSTASLNFNQDEQHRRRYSRNDKSQTSTKKQTQKFGQGHLMTSYRDSLSHKFLL
jgi:hypothetical protein